MPETRVRLDPAGFKRTIEEEIAMSFSGEELYTALAADRGGAVFPGGFFSPHGSGFLTCRPRQFNPRWYADSRLAEHVLHKDLWSWVPGLNVFDFHPPHKIGSPDYPDDRWFSFWVDPGVTSFFTVNWTAAGAACKLTLPATMKVVGLCGSTPAAVGIALSDPGSSHFTPFLQFVHYPAPDNCVAFGWSNLMVLLFGDSGYLLRTPNQDYQTWEQLASWGGGDYNSLIYRTIAEAPGSPYAEVEAMVRATVRNLLVMEMGDSSYYLFQAQGSPAIAKLRKSPGVGVLDEFLPGGAWWLAVPTMQKVVGQVQIVGYEVAEPGSTLPLTFDLGKGHAPTQTPSVKPAVVMHLAGSGFTETSVSDGTQLTSNATGEQVVYDLLVQATETPSVALPGDPWVSDGIIHKGSFFIRLVPSTAPGKPGGYLAPSVKLTEIVFPALLTPRVHQELILNDTEFDGWDIEASYHQPEDSTISIFLREEQALLLEDAGFARRRGNFPLLIEEKVGLLWVTRAAGWVETAELDEVKVENETVGDDGLKHWRIKARGLLFRADRRWRVLPQIIDPNGGGFVEQVYAVKKTLEMAHFDITDTDAVKLAADPNAGTSRGRLPATWALQQPRPGVKIKNAHGPSLTETKLAYCRRIATEWADWVLYTLLDGTVWYHPNLPIWLAEQETQFWSSLTLYKNTANAVLAGAPSQQVYREVDGHAVEPRANTWSIYGLDDDLAAFVVEEKAGDTITDIDDPDFVGEELPHLVKPKNAIREEACRQLAKVGVRRSKRRQQNRRFASDLAPWDMQGDDGARMDVGTGFTAEDRGEFIAVHIRCRMLHRAVYQTVITGEAIPSNALHGAAAGDYPGQGVEG